MEKIKEIWKELVEKYKDQKIELLLMLVFIAAAICLGAGEISQEAVSAGALGTAEDSRLGEAGEAEGPQSEKKGDSRDTNALDDTEDETSMEQEDGSEENTEDNMEDSTENMTEEADSEGMTEEESEMDAEEALETMRRHDRRRRSALGRDFIIPMAMPEGYVRPEYNEEQDENDEQSESVLTVYTLCDMRELHGYELLIPEEEEDDLTAEARLEAVLQERLASYDGDWSVYVKNLKTGQTALVNDRPMKSASIMKLFILGTMYKSFESGEMERTDEIVTLMNDMIIYSSNEASNELLYRLGDSDYGRGIAEVNEFIQEYGFSDMTVEYNGFDDPATNMGTGNYNQVSAKDCGRLLEAIYHREWVSRSVSNEIEQMMLNQNTRYKIPAGLPDGVSCGNKTGEMDTTENDAAIVYADSCDYILVVLSSDWNSKDEAISRIQSISSLVYQYFAE